MFYNIRMSLYEQFHSDINKEFMFDMVKKLILKEISIDISLDSENYDYFLTTFTKIFNDNDAEEIEEMNKYLLDHNIDYFVEKLKKPEPESPIMQDEFEKLLQEREKEVTISPKKEESIDILIKDFNENKPKKKKIKKVKEIENEKEDEKEEEEERTITIHSGKRTNINSSRYNYKIDLQRHSLSFKNIKSISKLVIPIEDNYLFTIPILHISIPELNCNVHMQQETIIQGNHRSYGVYHAIEKHTLNEPSSNRITIDIKDISERNYHKSDILKVNIVEIKKNKISLTCSSINEDDYQVKDFIKVINNNSHNLSYIFQDPLKIKKVQDNIIICDYKGLEELENRIYTNIDMKIMNMSNQNILYFQ